MCMVDDCDSYVTLLGESDPHARKAHTCSECAREITPGEKYHVDRYVFDGDMTAHKTCAHCMVVRRWLAAECGGWMYGGINEDIQEHASEGYGLGVARLAAGMSRKWERRDGSLRPVPHMPATTHQKMAWRPA